MNLFKKTIDSLVADITAKVEHLHIVATAHELEAEVHYRVVDERQALAALATAEGERARRIAGKFAELLS